jgi:hypothetical protein
MLRVEEEQSWLGSSYFILQQISRWDDHSDGVRHRQLGWRIRKRRRGT